MQCVREILICQWFSEKESRAGGCVIHPGTLRSLRVKGVPRVL